MEQRKKCSCTTIIFHSAQIVENSLEKFPQTRFSLLKTCRNMLEKRNFGSHDKEKGTTKDIHNDKAMTFLFTVYRQSIKKSFCVKENSPFFL